LKAHIESLLNAAIAGLQAEGGLPHDAAVQVEIEHTRSKEHGDFACNVALALAKAAKAKPRELAERIVKALPASPLVAKVEPALTSIKPALLGKVALLVLSVPRRRLGQLVPDIEGHFLRRIPHQAIPEFTVNRNIRHGSPEPGDYTGRNSASANLPRYW
jgi:hypothetical protein